jgi:hypothetical protein
MYAYFKVRVVLFTLIVITSTCFFNNMDKWSKTFLVHMSCSLLHMRCDTYKSDHFCYR